MSYDIVDENGNIQHTTITNFNKDDLLKAVTRFHNASKEASKNARLLISSSLSSEEASEIMRELDEAKYNLFKVAGLEK